MKDCKHTDIEFDKLVSENIKLRSERNKLDIILVSENKKLLKQIDRTFRLSVKIDKMKTPKLVPMAISFLVTMILTFMTIKFHLQYESLNAKLCISTMAWSASFFSYNLYMFVYYMMERDDD